VAFPVRCVKNAFVYATSLTAIARMERLLGIAGVRTGNGALPSVNEGECLIADRRCLTDNKLILESFEFTPKESKELMTLASWLSENALPEDAAFGFFRDKIKSDLVVLPEEDFSYFVRNATVVEPHVRISDVSGTAEEGGLFYTENLPPETLLLSLAMASRERYEDKKERSHDSVMSSEDVMSVLLTGKPKANSAETFKGIDNRMIQIGGDATTGRGQVFLKAVCRNGKEVSHG
jgi:CRISPR-associated protein Cmr4